VPIALAALVVAGVVLRALLTAARSPAFVGYHDTFFYVNAAANDLLGDLIRPAGYAIFLRLAHLPADSLSLTILIQHALGLATALLLFAAVARVAPAAWGLVPAAVVLLAGPQLFFEHAVMSESLFAFLLAAITYCAVRTLDAGPLPWAYLAGLLAAGAAIVRSLGSLLVAVVLGWLLLATPGGWRRRLGMTAAAALCAWLAIAVYVVEAKRETGAVGIGMTQLGGLNLYAGAATFADCDRFTPPPRTRALCDPRPPSERPGPYWYWISDRSPGLRRVSDPQSDQNAALSAFARAAIVHQPLAYMGKLGTHLSRFWSSDAHYDRYQGESYDVLADILVHNRWGDTAFIVRRWYATARPRVREGLLDAMRSYERRTRLEGPALVLLVLLALVGVPLARGARLKAGVLLLALSAAALLGPIASAWFNARFAIPGYGVLAASGAIGAASLWERAARRARRRREAKLLDGAAA
jgi:hypothetical protein